MKNVSVVLKDCISDSFPNDSGIIFFNSTLQKHARTVIHMRCALLESVPVQVDGPEMDNIAQVKCCFFFCHNLRCKNWLYEFTHSCFQYNHLQIFDLRVYLTYLLNHLTSKHSSDYQRYYPPSSSAFIFESAIHGLLSE